MYLAHAAAANSLLDKIHAAPPYDPFLVEVGSYSSPRRRRLPGDVNNASAPEPPSL
jgi:hypothetical protein